MRPHGVIGFAGQDAAVAVNLHFGHCTDVLQVIPPAARDHGWGRNVLALFPDVCGSSQSSSQTHPNQRFAPSPKLGNLSFHAFFLCTTH